MHEGEIQTAQALPFALTIKYCGANLYQMEKRFDDFKTKPTFSAIDEYLMYKKGVMNFIKSRNKRIETYAQHRTTK